MKIRQDIADLLTAGMHVRDVAAHLHVDRRAVAATRDALGLPVHRAIRRSTPLAEAFAARTEPTDDGHLLWTGARVGNAPGITINGRQTTARPFAFRLGYDRDPVGYVRPGCGLSECVRPDHMEDQPMREKTRTTYTAIFGGAA